MARNFHRPGEEHREKIFSLFLELSLKKTGPLRETSRSEIEHEIRNNPGKYPEFSGYTDTYLKICITKVLKSEPRAIQNPVWRRVWGISGRILRDGDRFVVHEHDGREFA